MRRWVFVFFAFCTISVSAQEKIQFKGLNLIDALKEIEEIYDVRFAFNPNIVEDLKINLNGVYDLKSVLTEIENFSSLSFEFLDFENILIKHNTDTELPSDTIKLDVIEITAEYLTAGFRQNKQETAYNLNPQDLDVLPGMLEPDVFQSLQLIPGISSSIESAAKLNIRGGTPDQNLVLFDNIPIYHLGHMFGNISSLNPYVVDQVKVYKSGTNAKYAGRISGVIDMKMDNNISEKTKVGLGLNPLHSDFNVKTPLSKKISLTLSARRSLTDALKTYTFRKFSNKVFQNTRISEVGNVVEEEEELEIVDNNLYFSDINTKLIYAPNEKHSIAFTGIRLENNLDFINKDERIFRSDALKLKNSGWAFNWRNQVNAKNEIKAKVHHSKYTSFYNFNENKDNDLIENLYRKNTVKDFGFYTRWRHQFTKESSLHLGYDYSTLMVDLEIDITGEHNSQQYTFGHEDIHAIFADYKFKKNKLLLNPGFRINALSRMKEMTYEPRFYAEYSISDYFKFKLNAELKKQIISQLVSFEFNELGIERAIWVMSDSKDIPILRNGLFAGGFIYRKNNWLVDFEAYDRSITGLTSFTKGFLANSENDFEQGISYSKGFDILLKRKFEKYRTWLAYTYAITEYQFAGLDDARFPGNNDQRHTLNISNSYKWNAFQFSLGWTLASGLPYSEEPQLIEVDGEKQLLFFHQNNLRMRSYHRLDASFVWNFKLGKEQNVKARLGIAVMNLYNRSNEIETIYDAQEDDNQQAFLISETIVGLKRTPNLVFRLWF